MANPFEDADGMYQVIVNTEGQYSLWPDSLTIPAGWEVAHSTDTRAQCISFIEENWTDMRPLSLIRAMGG
jgi:MbtH protein